LEAPGEPEDQLDPGLARPGEPEDQLELDPGMEPPAEEPEDQLDPDGEPALLPEDQPDLPDDDPVLDCELGLEALSDDQDDL